MILSFGSRLLLLSAAAFFLVHLAVAAVTALLVPAALRFCTRISAGRGADLLLSVRLAPTVLALLFVVSLAMPGYLWLEPKDTAEKASAACWCAAILGIGGWAVSISRACRAAIRSRRWAVDWIGRGHETLVHYEPCCILESATPVLALTGILRPRLVISRSVVATLTPPQLAAALRHERAHRDAHDNFKRLLLLLAPGILPFWHGFHALERARARLAEWAADDRAVAHSPSRSVVLAEALVRVARLGVPLPLSPLATPFSSNSLDLAARVERLLATPPRTQRPSPRTGPVLFALMAALVSVAVQPAVLLSVHRWLERLMD